MNHQQEELLKSAIEKGCEAMNINPGEVFTILKQELVAAKCPPPSKHMKGTIRKRTKAYCLTMQINDDWDADGDEVLLSDNELSAWFHADEVARIRELKTGREIKVLFFAQLKKKKVTGGAS